MLHSRMLGLIPNDVYRILHPQLPTEKYSIIYLYNKDSEILDTSGVSRNANI